MLGDDRTIRTGGVAEIVEQKELVIVAFLDRQRWRFTIILLFRH